MADTINVFVSYSHKDADYLRDDSLLGFLKGLEKEDIAFWTDRRIRVGESWDEVIKDQIEKAQIALVLVSQGFLDSDYCQNVEIKGLLVHKAHLFPIILSACEWERHEWLRSRQFLPGGQATLEEDYTEPGARKRLFLEIRQQLREQAAKVRRVRQFLTPLPPPAAGPVRTPYSGKTKLAFCQRLGDDWRMLADYLEIPPYDQARFERGDESRRIWVWLENRLRLQILPEALADIGRRDLAELLTQSHQ